MFSNDFDNLDQYITTKLEEFLSNAKSYYHNRSNPEKRIKYAIKINALFQSAVDEDIVDMYNLLNSSIRPYNTRVMTSQFDLDETYNDKIPADILFCHATLFDEIATRLIDYTSEYGQRISIDARGDIYTLSEDRLIKSCIRNIITSLDHRSLSRLHNILGNMSQEIDMSKPKANEVSHTYQMVQNYISNYQQNLEENNMFSPGSRLN